MTVARIKSFLSVAIVLGDAIAPLTNTKADDKAVALAKRLESNDVVLAFVAALFSGEPTNIARLHGADVDLANEVIANEHGLRALFAAADNVTCA